MTVFFLKCSSLGTSDIQGCYSPKAKGNYIYTFIHVIDSIPCRTTYIEYKSQGEYSSIFWGTPTNSIGCQCNVVFFHSSATPVVGVPLGEREKLMFLIQYKKNLRSYIFDTNRENPWKTMKTRGRFIHFWGMPPNSIGFHCNCKVVFSLFYDTGRGRYAWVSLKNSFL